MTKQVLEANSASEWKFSAIIGMADMAGIHAIRVRMVVSVGVRKCDTTAATPTGIRIILTITRKK